MNLGWTELLIIALVILELFGGRKIPELMKGLGKGVKSFKVGLREGDSEEYNNITVRKQDSKSSDDKNA